MNKEEIRKKFEEYISEDRPLGTVRDFFLEYDIKELSSDTLDVISEYIVKHYDYISFKYLLESFPKRKQDIIKELIEVMENIPMTESDDDDLLETIFHDFESSLQEMYYGKHYLFDEIINNTEKYSISDSDARILLKYISGVDFKSKQYNGIFKDLSFVSTEDIMSIIFKMDDDSKFKFISSLYNEYLFSYMPYNDSRYIIYRDMVSDFINCLSPNQIEELFASEKYKTFKYKTNYFCQIARKNPEKYNNIAKMLKNRSNKIELPDMSDIDKRIENGDIFTLDEMNDFYKKIDLIRQKNGIIPEKYCDFAIRNIFLSEHCKKESDNVLSEINFLSFCLIDKAFYILKHEGIDDVITYVDFIDKGAIHGKYNDNDKTIFLSIFVIELLQQGKYNTIIQTLFHEIQHAIQWNNIKNNNLNNFNEYIMLKEILIKKYNITEYGDNEFYTENYESITSEVDARIAGRYKMYNYLKSLGIPSNKILDGSGKNYNGDVYKFLTDEATDLYKPKKEFIINDNQKSMDSIFDKLIKENGPKVISENPILKYEYDDDGSRKCSMEILQEYEDLMLSKDYNPSKFSLQEYLIKKDYKLDSDKVREMIFSDAADLENFTPKTEKGKELVEEVIIYRILNYLPNLYDEISILKENNHYEEYLELLADAKEILVIVSDYKNKNMKDVKSDINLSSTDKQKAKELAQMIDNIKQKEIDYSEQMSEKVI